VILQGADSARIDHALAPRIDVTIRLLAEVAGPAA
jgi:hypothetical protein